MESPDTEFWSRLAGRAANGYPLKTLLGGSNGYATYATEYGPDARPAAIKVIDASRGASKTQLARWAKISQLSHPNLISVLDYGECGIDDVPLLYVVMEWAEDNLSSVLAVRPLSPSETKEMLEPIIAVIGHLHGQGLVHTAIQPSNILANGDRLKLSSDSITPAGEVNAGHESSAYGPPESNPGIASFPGDVWSLGMTLVQALTQQVPGPDAHDEVHKNLPDPFAEVVRHCLKWDPDERWSVTQIASRLRGPAPPEVSEPLQAAVIERTPRKTRPKWLIPVFGGILAVVAVFALLHKGTQSISPSPELPQRVGYPQEPLTPPARPSAPQPAGKPPAPIDGAVAGHGWFVVANTYTRRQDAEKRVEAMKRQWPNFEPEVYPKGMAPFYLVILGNDVSQQAASALQADARAAGLPRDTYITNRPAKR